METVPLAKYEAERKEHLKLQAKYLKIQKELEVLGFAQETIITCANCGYEFTHHYKVEVYFRHEEDASYGIKTTVSGRESNTTTGNNQLNSPSTRRDGVRIYLSCENCDKKTLIGIIQHKGQTFLTLSKGVDFDSLSPSV